MTRKHYVALADILHANYRAAEAADTGVGSTSTCHRALVRQVAYDLCRYLATENPRFSEPKFLAACLEK